MNNKQKFEKLAKAIDETCFLSSYSKELDKVTPHYFKKISQTIKYGSGVVKIKIDKLNCFVDVDWMDNELDLILRSGTPSDHGYWED